MANITDRTAYLRGLAEGMKLDREVNEQRLILELLDVMDEISDDFLRAFRKAVKAANPDALILGEA